MSNGSVFEDSDDVTREGDSAVVSGAAQQPYLQIYERGPVTVVGFGGMDVPTEACIAVYRDALRELLDQEQCHTLGVDLTGVTFMPSGLLGTLVSITQRGVTVQIFNPSDHVRDTLELTKMDRLFDVRDVDV